MSGLVGPRPLIIHWNGSSWSRVPAPTRGSIEDENLILGVAALTATDAWAVGSFRKGDSNVSRWAGGSPQLQGAADAPPYHTPAAHIGPAILRHLVISSSLACTPRFISTP